MAEKYEIIHWNLKDHKQIALVDNEEDIVLAHFLFDYSKDNFDKKLEFALQICETLNKSAMAKGSIEGSNCNISDVSNNEVAVCPRCKSNKIAESEEHHSFMDCCNCGLTWAN